MIVSWIKKAKQKKTEQNKRKQSKTMHKNTKYVKCVGCELSHLHALANPIGKPWFSVMTLHAYLFSSALVYTFIRNAR